MARVRIDAHLGHDDVARIAVATVLAVLAVKGSGWHAVAIAVEQPLAAERPIPLAVGGVLGYADVERCGSAVAAVTALATIAQRHGAPGVEGDGIGAVSIGDDIGDVAALLDGKYDLMKCRHLHVGLEHRLLQILHTAS